MKKIILLLGSPNDSQGNLSRTAVDRNECAYSIYTRNDDVKILCTGGYGEHFNTTGLPHAQYAKDYLSAKGVEEEDFMTFILSSNTYEDLEMAKPVIEEHNPELLIVITSDFHMERVRILFKRLVDYPRTLFVPATTTLDDEQLLPLILHEEHAVKKLKEKE